MPPVTREQIMAEVVRAERRAEKVLKRNWMTVEKVANALLASRKGNLSGVRVRKLTAELLQ